MRLNKRNRIFIAILTIYAVGVFALLYNLLQGIDPRYRESAEDSLVETAHLLASISEQYVRDEQLDIVPIQKTFNRLYQRGFSAQIFGVHKNKVEIRAYIVDKNGHIIYDSLGQNVGADYSNWRDVSLALKGEYGARTTSDIPNDKTSAVMYVSAPIYTNNKIIGAITVGKPVLSFGQYISNARTQILYTGLFSAFAIVIFALIVAVWLTQPLGLVSDYIRYVRAQQSINLPRLGRRALDMLVQGYENMRDTLAGQHYVKDYVQSLTHELKSPLSAIRGAAELLQEPMPEAQRQRFLKNIERETQRVQELVEHMKELTTLEQSRTIQNPQTIPLQPLLDELTSSAQAIAATRHIQIHLTIPEDTTPLVVEGDRLLLLRAIRNLLDNAIAFSPDHGHIGVTLIAAKRTAQIIIQDQGPGIPDYAQNRIFDRFYSLSRPGTQKKSTGLGLAFVKEITILHHGTITLRNANPSDRTAWATELKKQGHSGAIANLKLPLLDMPVNP